MSEDEKGKRFLELIDQHNTIQSDIIIKLIKLIEFKWNSSTLQIQLENLIEKHSKITNELNSLD